MRPARSSGAAAGAIATGALDGGAVAVGALVAGGVAADGAGADGAGLVAAAGVLGLAGGCRVLGPLAVLLGFGRVAGEPGEGFAAAGALGGEVSAAGVAACEGACAAIVPASVTAAAGALAFAGVALGDALCDALGKLAGGACGETAQADNSSEPASVRQALAQSGVPLMGTMQLAESDSCRRSFPGGAGAPAPVAR